MESSHRVRVVAFAAGLAFLTGCSLGPDPVASGTGAPDPVSAGTGVPDPGPGGTGVPEPGSGGTGVPEPGSGGTGVPGPGSGGTGLPAPGDSTTVPGRPVPTPGSAVPVEVMLRAGDWPGGRVLQAAGTGPAALPATEPAACQDRTAYPSDRHRLAARTVSIGSPEPESGGVRQLVVRYAPGRAGQAMAEMRRVLAACHRYRPADVEPVWTRSYRLEAERFAGDDALLVRRADRADGTDRDWGYGISVVRVGDALVTTISEVGEGVVDPALVRRLAQTGAHRAACLRTTC